MAGGDKKLYTPARRITVKSLDIRLINCPAARVSPEVAKQQLMASYGMTEQLLLRVAQQAKESGPAAPNIAQEQRTDSDEEL